MTRRTHAAAAIVALALAGGLACGGAETNAPAGPPLASTVIVSFTSFQPLVDTIKVGGTISWGWSMGSTDHNILSVGNSFVSYGDSLGTTYDSPSLYEVMFPTVGSYSYFCSVHGSPTIGMKGRIDVLP